MKTKASDSMSKEDIQDEFVSNLLARLSEMGIDTSNWDGDEGLLETLAKSIAAAINEHKIKP